MSSNLVLFVAILLVAPSAWTMSIAFTDISESPHHQADPDKNPANHLSNETLRKIYEKASEIINSTGADSVLMQLQPVNPRDPQHQANLMLLIVKKPNSTDQDILNQFNAFYVNTAKADVEDPNLISAFWNFMFTSARDFLTKRFQTFLNIFKSWSPGSGSTNKPSAGPSSGRTHNEYETLIPPYPIVFRQHNHINDKENNNPNDLIFLFQEPVADSPDVILTDENIQAAINASKAGNFSSSIITDKGPPAAASPNGVKPPSLIGAIGIENPIRRILGLTKPVSRYMLRPVGAFTGMSSHSADKAYTSVGTMITHTGLHLSLVDRSTFDSLGFLMKKLGKIGKIVLLSSLLKPI